MGGEHDWDIIYHDSFVQMIKSKIHFKLAGILLRDVYFYCKRAGICTKHQVTVQKEAKKKGRQYWQLKL